MCTDMWIRTDGNKPFRRYDDRYLFIETIDGDPAVIVKISGLGDDASPSLVDTVEKAIRTEVGHLVRE